LGSTLYFKLKEEYPLEEQPLNVSGCTTKMVGSLNHFVTLRCRGDSGTMKV